MRLKISNYRCFHESEPLEFELSGGFTSFIGVNNSGKSSILKFFYEFRNLFEHLKEEKFIKAAMEGMPRGFSYPGTVYDQVELFNNLSKGDIQIEITLDDEDGTPLSLLINVPYGSAKCTIDFRVNGDHVPSGRIGWSNPLNSLHANGKSLMPLIKQGSELANTLYIGPFRNALNKGEDTAYYDLEIGEAFIRRWAEMKQGNNKKQNQAAIELEDELTRIFEFDSLQISPSNDGKTLKINIDRKSYMLPELGAGLAEFIVVLASAFVKKPKYLLIDEPELHLHPSLQLDFLTTLASQTDTGGVVFATHSPGLAHTSSEHAYIVNKVSHGKSTVKETRKDIPLTALLGELAYPGYSDSGNQKILLVEGTHDVKVFQQFLRLYNSGIEHQVVIVPLGGSSLISSKTKDQLIEITKLSSNIFAIIDSEKTPENTKVDAGRLKFKKNCEDLGITCHILERRATENYLTENAIKAVKSDKYSQLGENEVLKDTMFPWGKHENWIIARNMNKDDIKETDLADFLEKVIE